MLERFFPVKFFGFGGFIDVVVDRCYGHGFDVNDPKDVALIRFLRVNNRSRPTGVKIQKLVGSSLHSRHANK